VKRSGDATVALVVFSVFALLGLTRCGDGDLTIPGSIPPTETATPVETPSCLPAGDVCGVASDCCSGVCNTLDGENFTCG
jgi:hypothetical protein